jgi:hypothetical protein
MLLRYAEDPAFEICDFLFFLCQRRVKVPVQRPLAVGLFQPPSHAVSVMLIGRPVLSRVPVPEN